MRGVFVALLFLSALMANAEETLKPQPPKSFDEEKEISLTQIETAANDAAQAKAESKKAEVKKESEIPVLTESKKKEAGSMGIWQRLMMSAVIVLVAVGALTVLLKKYRSKHASQNKGLKIKILSQQFLGPKKSLVIVEVAGESMLLGVTDHNVSLIRTLSLLEEEMPAQTPDTFSSALQGATQGEIDEDFGIAGIKDRVRFRLKNMRNLS